MLENKMANKKPLEVQGRGKDLMRLQGQETGSVREAPKREKTPEKRGMTVIRKPQRREGQFWHRRYRAELSGTGGKPGQPVKAS